MDSSLAYPARKESIRRLYARGLKFAASQKENFMMDLVFVALAIGFFAASYGLVHLFERMREHQ